MPRAGTPFQLYLGAARRTALEALTAAHRRSLHDEIMHAIDRHLAHPPVMHEPALPASPVEPMPKGKPGRKKKGGN